MMTLYSSGSRKTSQSEYALGPHWPHANAGFIYERNFASKKQSPCQMAEAFQSHNNRSFKREKTAFLRALKLARGRIH